MHPCCFKVIISDPKLLNSSGHVFKKWLKKALQNCLTGSLDKSLCSVPLHIIFISNPTACRIVWVSKHFLGPLYLHRPCTSFTCSDESYHIRNMVRVHLIEELIIDVGIGKIKTEVKKKKKSMLQSTYFRVFCMKSLKWGVWTDPSTRSPMFSRWPRNVLQWYWWPESISDVFWTQTSANTCCKHRQKYNQMMHQIQVCVVHEKQSRADMLRNTFSVHGVIDYNGFYFLLMWRQSWDNPSAPVILKHIVLCSDEPLCIGVSHR